MTSLFLTRCGRVQQQRTSLSRLIIQRARVLSTLCPVSACFRPKSRSITGKENFRNLVSLVAKTAQPFSKMKSTICGLCTQHPLCSKCYQAHVDISISVGLTNVRTLSMPFQDAFWDGKSNRYVMKVAMKLRVDLFWRQIVRVNGLQIDLIRRGYRLFPEEAELPDGIHIHCTNSVTLIGFFNWYEVTDKEKNRMRRCFKGNVDILARPTSMMAQKVWIRIIQVALPPTFLQRVQ